MTPDAIDAVFVYGTLKRGECRASLWPFEPTDVQAASIRGDLWGREDYPALLPGESDVLGELWTFQEWQMERTLEVLDDIEGCRENSPSDLYHRHTVEVLMIPADSIRLAFVYQYARSPERDGFRRLACVNGYQSWPER
ncbi:MAG: gamma-glutamylcyclotransferase family protein [Planctomycetota bacterium]